MEIRRNRIKLALVRTPYTDRRRRLPKALRIGRIAGPAAFAMTETPGTDADGAGFGRDRDLEASRGKERPAEADLDATRAKAGREPTIDYAPDPDPLPDG